MGLIPARAGRTARRTTSTARPPAHPRSRGEDPIIVRSAGNGLGSSPLARGGLEDRLGWNVALGLIPARAGRTRRYYSRPSGLGAHPRSRGEDLERRGY